MRGSEGGKKLGKGKPEGKEKTLLRGGWGRRTMMVNEKEKIIITHIFNFLKRYKPSLRINISLLSGRDWSKDEFKSHFEGGVRLGVGTFNLMMSLLPTRITKLMEFVGFAGSKVSKFS